MVVGTEKEESEDSSSREESQNHVRSTSSAAIGPEVSSKEPSASINLTFNADVQFLPISPRTSVGPSLPIPSRIPVPQERPYHTSDVQQTSQTLKGKTKVPSKLDMPKQVAKIGLPSSTDKCIQRWEDYHDEQDARQKERNFRRWEKS